MDSPFTCQLHTNYVPSDAEIKYIQADLILHSAELARLDNLITQLSAQREQLQAYVNAHKALISYARRMPHDIVQEIFLACLPDDADAKRGCPQEAPQLLCRICSGWRAIALSTPQLWTSLHLSVEFVMDSSPRKAFLDRWVQRSAALPISLS
ncbi:hypothetical protein C8R44DRAFT_680533, partial [Mycena epipterygia]